MYEAYLLIELKKKELVRDGNEIMSRRERIAILPLVIPRPFCFLDI